MKTKLENVTHNSLQILFEPFKYLLHPQLSTTAIQ